MNDKYKMNLEKIPVKQPKRNINLEFYVRPDTTDVKVIDEVIYKNTYQKNSLGFLIEPGQTWLDLGGNIGTFTVLALASGADKVISYEPEPDNYNLLSQNIVLNGFAPERYQLYNEAVSDKQEAQVELYMCRGTYNKYRHSLIKIRGRPTITVDCVTMDQIRLRNPEINSCKADIEGKEIAILESYNNWDGIDRLVFEYSFDVDPSIPRFLAIIERLKQWFATVHYLKVKADELEYKYYPRATMVYCLK